MSMGSDTSWVGKKPLRRLGGMSDALSIAADLGFSVNPPPSQVLSFGFLNFTAFFVNICITVSIFRYNINRGRLIWTISVPWMLSLICFHYNRFVLSPLVFVNLGSCNFQFVCWLGSKFFPWFSFRRGLFIHGIGDLNLDIKNMGFLGVFWIAFLKCLVNGILICSWAHGFGANYVMEYSKCLKFSFEIVIYEILRLCYTCLAST